MEVLISENNGVEIGKEPEPVNEFLDVNSNSGIKRPNDIKQIEKSIVHRICSGQVIVTLSTAVKELVENSMDAGATSIEIRLVDYGSKVIEVIDNGAGIADTNFDGLALKHYTSKLIDFEDLSSIATFGFRGEAISSLCALAKLSVLTKTSDSKQAFRIEYDSLGKLTSKSQCARQCGTTVILHDLFSPLPVRHKEFLKNLKREFHKMVNILYGYCILNPSVRISCTNQIGSSQNKIFSVPGHQTLRERIISLFGSKQLSSLMDITQLETVDSSILAEYGIAETSSCDTNIQLEGLISKPHCGRSSNDRQFFFINSRPCEPAKISRLVNEIYHNYGRNHYPFVCLLIKTKQENIDVNLTPDKRMVYLQNEKFVYATIKASLQSIFLAASSSFDSSTMSQSFNSEQSSTDTESLSSPSSSQECQRSSPAFRKTGRISALVSASMSDSLNKFSSQSSPSEYSPSEDKRTNIRSILQRFSLGSSTSNDNSISVVTCSKANSQPYKRPREKSNSLGSKQPRLMDFIKSRGVKLCTTRTPEPEDSEDDITIISETANSSLSVRNFNIFLEKEKCEVEDDDKSSLTSDEDTQTTENDSSFFSQTSNNTMITNSSSQDSENKNNVIIYDDELEDIQDSLNNGQDNFIHKDVSVHINWGHVKERLKQKRIDELKSIKQNQFSRKFRAKISASDNSTAEEELRRELSKEMFSEMKVIGQFNLGFIIVKHFSDLFIIDQHASDEKYNFERLQSTTVLQSQRLISPIFMQLPAVSENILIDNLEVFQKNGFKFEINDEAEPTFRVNLAEIPYSKNYEFGKEDVEELIFMLEDAPEKCFCRPSKVRLMFASRACRKSVMIGTDLNLKTMRDIVLHMGQMEQPWNCPHGRPTLRHLFNLSLLPDLDVQRFNH